MDIRNWPIHRIMQLPDCCFGSRWLMGHVGEGSGTIPVYRITRCALPEWAVLWELKVLTTGFETIRCSVSFKLGDQLPTTDVEFDAMESMLPCIECLEYNVDRIVSGPGQVAHIVNLRMPIHTAGRRVVTRHAAKGPAKVESAVLMVWSSIPTEVPDWLISARG